MERVGKDKKYLCIESFRNENEKANLLTGKIHVNPFTILRVGIGGLKKRNTVVIIPLSFLNKKKIII